MEPQQLSVWLNRSAFPRAIADFERQCFVSWNSTFLERTGYSEDRLKVIRPEQIIVLGDGQFPLASRLVFLPLNLSNASSERRSNRQRYPGMS